MRTRLDFDGFAGAAEAAAAPYLYVPFEVPLHCSRLDVSYQYMAVHGEEPCTVDIGIFDVRGTEPFTGGFRGWSGSDRRTFFIAHERATPGYVAGPLPSGRWSALLGLYEVPPSGVRWWVTVELEFAAEPLPDVSMRTGTFRAFAPRQERLRLVPRRPPLPLRALRRCQHHPRNRRLRPHPGPRLPRHH